MRHPAAAHRYDVLYEVTTILAVAGLAISAVGTIQQGNATKQQGLNQQAEANLQAQIRRQEAARATQVSAQQAGQYEREQSALRARARAVRAGSGTIPNVGTSLLVDQDIASEIARNKAMIEAGGAAQATRLEQDATLLGLQGSNAARSGSAAQAGSYFGAGATALTGASKFNYGSTTPKPYSPAPLDRFAF